MRLRFIACLGLLFSCFWGIAQEERSAFQNGLIYYTSQDQDEAIVALYDAVAASPDNPLVWFYRGLCRKAIGEHTGALSDLNKALKLDPDNIHMMFNRAMVLRTIGQRQRAINDLERALYLSPTGSVAIEALNELGRMNIGQNSYTEALENYTQLIALTPDNQEAYYYRGLCHGHMNDHVKAIADHTKALEIKPSYGEALEARAIQHVVSGNASLACDDLYLAKELGALYAKNLIDNFCE